MLIICKKTVRKLNRVLFRKGRAYGAFFEGTGLKAWNEAEQLHTLFDVRYPKHWAWLVRHFQ